MAVLTAAMIPGRGALAAGLLGYSASHTYLDDGPTPNSGTPSNAYTINVSVTDDDAGSCSAGSPVRCGNGQSPNSRSTQVGQ